jgi:xanthine dehydrogenase accessory factor
MLVSADAIFGTIGGGQLEFMAIDTARAMMLAGGGNRNARHPARARDRPVLRRPGGTRLRRSSTKEARGAVADRPGGGCGRPHVLLFGGGHVGRALSAALSLLPLHVVVVETRADALADMPQGVETRLTSMPEEAVRDAPPGSAFIVLTHDHALDFLIVAEALAREDAAYVGMIGSKTKKETLRRWYLKEAGGDETSFARVVCPIGGAEVKDKRPAVIAALVAAEVMRALSAASARGSA